MTTVAGVALLAGMARLSYSPLVRSLLLAGASGAAFGVASVMTKTETVGVSDEGIGAVSVPALAAIALFGVGGLLLGQLSYRHGGLAAPLAMVSVTNPVVATTVGILLLGEGFRFGTMGAVLALVAAAVATCGVIGLAARTAAPASVIEWEPVVVPGGVFDRPAIRAGLSDQHHEVLAACPRNRPRCHASCRPRGTQALADRVPDKGVLLERVGDVMAAFRDPRRAEGRTQRLAGEQRCPSCRTCSSQRRPTRDDDCGVSPGETG